MRRLVLLVLLSLPVHGPLAAGEAVRLACGPSPGLPHLEIFLARDHAVIRGFARMPYASSACIAIDPGGLAWNDGRIDGQVALTHPAMPDAKGREAAARTWTVALSARQDGGDWSGTARAGKSAGALSGSAVEAIDPSAAGGALLEIALHAGQTADAYPIRLLRLEVQGGACVRAIAYAPKDETAEAVTVDTLNWDERRLAVEGGIGSGDPRERFQAAAVLVGGRGGGSASLGSNTGTCLVRITPRTGRLPPPTLLHAAGWAAAFDAQPDAGLVAAARTEARMPIRAGSPAGPFWNWRHRGAIPAIAAPVLPLLPVTGAARYRQTWTSGGTVTTTTVAEPWATPAATWDALPTGPCSVEVVALDAAGSVLSERPQRFRRTRIDLAQRARDPKRKPKPAEIDWVARGLAGGQPDPVPSGPVALIKRVSFQGPYYTLPPDWGQRIDRAARAVVEYPSLLPSRGLGLWHEPTADGDHGIQREVPSAIFAWLAVADADPRWLTEAETSGHALLAGIHAKSGLVHTYQGHADIQYRSLACLVDLAVATRSQVWRQRAIDYATALCRFQQPGGSWVCIDAATGAQHKPDGFFDAELVEFCPSQLLWQLGRLRTQLGHDALREYEDRAHSYLRANSLTTWEWPNQGYHSATLGYPYRLAGQNPLAYAFYLMECADPAQRDPALITDLLRWCEDVHVDWSRQAPAAGTPAFPRLIDGGDGYRSEGYPIRMAAWQALAWAELYALTRLPLHRAKAEAFLAAVLTAQDPGSGAIDLLLRTGGRSSSLYHRFCDSHGEAMVALQRCRKVMSGWPAASP